MGCMASMYNGRIYGNEDNTQLRVEITQLKSEIHDLKLVVNKFEEFMKTKGSFMDFKVFKFNEEEELRKKEEAERQRSERFYQSMRQMIR